MWPRDRLYVAGFAGQINTSVTAQKPGVTITSAKTGSACPGPVTSTPGPTDGHLGGDPTNVSWGSTGTVNNRLITNTHVDNLLITASATAFQGLDANNTAITAFPAYFGIFDGDEIKPTANGAAILYKFGAWYQYGNFIDQSGFDGDALSRCRSLARRLWSSVARSPAATSQRKKRSGICTTPLEMTPGAARSSRTR